MGDKSLIEWTDATWNPVTGCTKVSPGCDNCYAERLALGRHRRFYPQGFVHVELRPDRLGVPLSWRQGRKIFPCAQSDLFHPRVPFDFIAQVFNVMAMAKHHTFQVLTKRPGRMAYFASEVWNVHYAYLWPSNVWAGTSVEQEWDGRRHLIARLDALARVPAPVRFVSCEPLLGLVDLTPWLEPRCRLCGGLEPQNIDGLPPCEMELPLNWVVAGGESGPRARPMHPDWVRSIRDQCQAAGIPFFFKQWGEWLPDDHCTDEQWHRARERYGREEPYSRLGEGPGALTVSTFQRWALVGRKAAGALLDGKEYREWPM